MSKLSVHVAMSVLISLAVMAVIYTAVLGASAGSSENRSGSHLVSGAKVNLDHYRSADPAPSFLQSDFQGNQSHDCNSDLQSTVDD